MHAYLVVGAAPDQRIRFVESLLTDHGVEQGPNARYLLESPTASIGIDAVRRVQTWIGQSSSRRRACIIPDADRLTQEAQHAMLKTIEEPTSDHTIFVMSASSEGTLLPTLRSRCVIRRVAAVHGALHPEPFRIPRAELLTHARSDRESTQRVFDRLIRHAHQTLVVSSSQTPSLPEVLRVALNAQARLNAQCSLIPVIRQFLLDIPTSH